MKKQLFCLALIALMGNAYACDTNEAGSSESYRNTKAILTDEYEQGCCQFNGSENGRLALVAAAIRKSAWPSLENAGTWTIPKATKFNRIPVLWWSKAPTFDVESISSANGAYKIVANEGDRALIGQAMNQSELNPVIVRLHSRKAAQQPSAQPVALQPSPYVSNAYFQETNLPADCCIQ